MLLRVYGVLKQGRDSGAGDQPGWEAEKAGLSEEHYGYTPSLGHRGFILRNGDTVMSHLARIWNDGRCLRGVSRVDSLNPWARWGLVYGSPSSGRGAVSCVPKAKTVVVS